MKVSYFLTQLLILSLIQMVKIQCYDKVAKLKEGTCPFLPRHVVEPLTLSKWCLWHPLGLGAVIRKDQQIDWLKGSTG